MNVKFYLDSKTNKNGQKTIYTFIRGIKGIKTIYLKTDYKIFPNQWNKNKNRVNKNHPDNDIINNALERIRNIIINTNENIKHSGKNITANDLKLALDLALNPRIKSDSAEKNISFFDIYDEMVSLREELSISSQSKYHSVKNHLLNFQKEKHYPVTFESINFTFDDLFRKYLISELKLTNNTVNQIYSKLKVFMKWASDRNYHSNNLYTKMIAKVSDTEVIYLEFDELMKIYNLDLSNNTALSGTRDLFIFACFSGQRFSDVIRIMKDDIRDGFWHLRTEKTQDILKIPINDYSQEILDKYFTNGLTFPKINYQTVNTNLKKIGKLAELNDQISIHRYSGANKTTITKQKYEFLTFHIARKTFVTLSLNKGMPIQVVMEITGHKDFDTLKKYYKINPSVTKEIMKNIWKKNEIITFFINFV